MFYIVRVAIIWRFFFLALLECYFYLIDLKFASDTMGPRWLIHPLLFYPVCETSLFVNYE